MGYPKCVSMLHFLSQNVVPVNLDPSSLCAKVEVHYGEWPKTAE